jgi:hypothetical protein
MVQPSVGHAWAEGTVGDDAAFYVTLDVKEIV